MGDDLAAANVGRSYSLAATSIAIFTFVLFFLYPRVAAGEVNATLFQTTLVTMGIATFAFVLSSLHYYRSSVDRSIKEADRARCCRLGDRFWLLGYSLLFLAPTLVLFAIGLRMVGAAWLALWLVFLLLVARYFPNMQTVRIEPTA